MKKFIFFLLLLIVPISFLLLNLKKIIKIKKIICTTQFGPCPEDLLFNLSPESLSQNNKVQNFSTQYIFPNTLQYKLILSKPLINLFLESQNKTISLDASGIVLGQAVSQDLPLIYARPNSPSDQNTYKYISNIVHFISAENQISDITLKNDQLFFLYQNTNIILPIEGDIDETLGKIRLTLSWLNSYPQNFRIEEVERGLPESIDLRFKDPLISWPNE